MSHRWPAFEPAARPWLGAEDDPALWSVVVNTVFHDAELLCGSVGPGRVLTQLGRCSHWLRPHQTRWTADGGFAWPTGYAGSQHSRSGLPEFDWFAQWEWRPDSNTWSVSEGEPGPRQCVFRVAIPARTHRHGQAAVHTCWLPSSPARPRAPLTQFYGFRKQPQWQCTAYFAHPNQRAYDLAASQNRS